MISVLEGAQGLYTERGGRWQSGDVESCGSGGLRGYSTYCGRRDLVVYLAMAYFTPPPAGTPLNALRIGRFAVALFHILILAVHIGCRKLSAKSPGHRKIVPCARDCIDRKSTFVGNCRSRIIRAHIACKREGRSTCSSGLDRQHVGAQCMYVVCILDRWTGRRIRKRSQFCQFRLETIGQSRRHGEGQAIDFFQHRNA